MADADDVDEDLFADLYDGEEDLSKPAPAANVTSAQPAVQTDAALLAAIATVTNPTESTGMTKTALPIDPQQMNNANDTHTYGNALNQITHAGASNGASSEVPRQPDNYRSHSPIGIKEDGKMFIGGLNWETTDQSLRTYFEEFGEVLECTVMRDGASGRSRGFGFLTFKDPKTVNTVMVKEHYLDGKIIDPKRAIPRDEQEKTSKIFVGGVSQEATERDFEQFFTRFGRVIDATLMMDKDTGRPRGFGFVTFDSEAAVEATLAGPLEIMGKMIEVKKAQPRGNMRDMDDDGGRGKFNRRGNDRNERSGREQGNNQNSNTDNQNQGQQNGNNANNNGMSPAMMAAYWQRMQMYFAMRQQQLASTQQGMGGGMGMGNMGAMGNMQGMGGQMDPAMMQQMMAMQGGMNQGVMNGSQEGSPNAPSQGMGGSNMGNMSPAQMQQMQQMAQMQNMQSVGSNGGGSGGGGGFENRIVSPVGGGIGAAPGPNRPAYNAQEQLAFEQQKYEQQQARRTPSQGNYGQYNQGGPTSWEGMYDDVPQPNIGPQGGSGRHGRGKGSQNATPQPSGQAPANAPTGPKNAGKPGANYRGGGRSGGGRHGFHPYSRNG